MPNRTESRSFAPPAMPRAHRPQPDRWRDAGVEPTLGDLMNDPLTALIMRRDGIGRDDVLAAVAEARWRLSRPHRQEGPAARALRMARAASMADHRQAAC